jgi:hypothetical protein
MALAMMRPTKHPRSVRALVTAAASMDIRRCVRRRSGAFHFLAKAGSLRVATRYRNLRLLGHAVVA